MSDEFEAPMPAGMGPAVTCRHCGRLALAACVCHGITMCGDCLRGHHEAQEPDRG